MCFPVLLPKGFSADYIRGCNGEKDGAQRLELLCGRINQSCKSGVWHGARGGTKGAKGHGAAQEIEGNVDTNTGNKAHSRTQSRTQDTGHRMRRAGHETCERDSELLCGSISEIVITEKAQQIHRRHDGAIQRGRCAMIRGHSRYDRDAQGVKQDTKQAQDTGHRTQNATTGD